MECNQAKVMLRGSGGMKLEHSGITGEPVKAGPLRSPPGWDSAGLVWGRRIAFGTGSRGGDAAALVQGMHLENTKYISPIC